MQWVRGADRRAGQVGSCHHGRVLRSRSQARMPYRGEVDFRSKASASRASPPP